MSAPAHKRPRGDGGTSVDDCHDVTSPVNDELRTLLRSALGAAAALLASHSAAAQSLVTADEDAVDAAITCCATLLREHGIKMDTATAAVGILGALAGSEQTSWRDLLRLQDRPLAAPLADCDEAATQRLHTISEVLQFPKRVSLLLQRQLAVFRIRRDAAAAAGGCTTAALVHAEPVLAPLLEQAAEFVRLYVSQPACAPSGSYLHETPAFWRGLFGDPEDIDSMETGRREVDHIAYGAGRIVGGRGLLPDLLQAPAPSCAPMVSVLATAAAAVGDGATFAALHHASREINASRCMCAAAETGQVEVIRLAVSLGLEFSVKQCLWTAAQLTNDAQLAIAALFRDGDPAPLGLALPAFARCGDVQGIQRLLRLCHFVPDELDSALVWAAERGHIPTMQLLLDNGATLISAAFEISATVAVLQWCVERGCTVDSTFLQQAAANGRVFQLEWAATLPHVSALLDAKEFIDAAAGCEVIVMEWLHARGCPWAPRALSEACAARDAESVAFALRHGCPLVGITWRDLAELPLDGLKAAVQALHDSGRSEAVNHAEMFRGAEYTEHVEAVEWLVCDLGFPISADECAKWSSRYGSLGYHAAARGCLRLLQHLHANGYHAPCPADMRAVFFDRLLELPGTRGVEVVRWLHAQGVPTFGPALEFERASPEPGLRRPAINAPDFLTFEAASRGALELLQVLVEECGAHWTEPACAAAAAYGRMEVLRWAISKHCPCASAAWCAAVRRGGRRNDYRPLALLHSAKCPWDEAVWAAAASYGEVRAWLQERGYPGSQATPAAGAGSGAGDHGGAVHA